MDLDHAVLNSYALRNRAVFHETGASHATLHADRVMLEEPNI